MSRELPPDPARPEGSGLIDWRVQIRAVTLRILEEICKWCDHRDPAVIGKVKQAARDALGAKPLEETTVVGARDASGSTIPSMMRLTPAGYFRVTLDRCGIRREDPYVAEVVMKEIVEEANGYLNDRDLRLGRACPPEQLIEEGGRQYRKCSQCERLIDLELIRPDARDVVRDGKVGIRCDLCKEKPRYYRP
jgi:hypothetical protein